MAAGGGGGVGGGAGARGLGVEGGGGGAAEFVAEGVLEGGEDGREGYFLGVGGVGGGVIEGPVGVLILAKAFCVGGRGRGELALLRAGDGAAVCVCCGGA